ncbi:unnamed protein product [Medioppia subpectinata]|uniref:Uncharacterized protein n=1 Tax=Medioppia subpectinata TaxID=1979941 RepID=A0A7R9PYX5_9ACAR|nr:unnamed protein product [Medioppia subpectinata]CAG2106326.1 unnamed protein product [Medioppia subpectinata]
MRTNYWPSRGLQPNDSSFTTTRVPELNGKAVMTSQPNDSSFTTTRVPELNGKAVMTSLLSAPELPVRDWVYYNEPNKLYGKQYAGGRVKEVTGKTLGGSSSHNGMGFNRGNRRGTYAADLRRRRETDINGPIQTGYTQSQLFINSSGLRSGTGTMFIDPNPYPDNLHIVCKALVTKILFNGLTAIGVEFIVNDISYTVYANREVIVSAGCPDCPDKQYLYECVEGLKCFIKYNTNSGDHPTGTCRMGAIERSDVVVDPQLRVKGANNLRVCDASVFPVIPNANTVSAAILTGYKCAQNIKSDYNL